MRHECLDRVLFSNRFGVRQEYAFCGHFVRLEIRLAKFPALLYAFQITAKGMHIGELRRKLFHFMIGQIRLGLRQAIEAIRRLVILLFFQEITVFQIEHYDKERFVLAKLRNVKIEFFVYLLKALPLVELTLNFHCSNHVFLCSVALF